MSIGSSKDHDLVNFSQDYELDYILDRYNKSNSIENRRILLYNTSTRCKAALRVKVVTHAQFYPFVEQDLYLLPNKQTRI